MPCIDRESMFYSEGIPEAGWLVLLGTDGGKEEGGEDRRKGGGGKGGGGREELGVVSSSSCSQDSPPVEFRTEAIARRYSAAVLL